MLQAAFTVKASHSMLARHPSTDTCNCGVVIFTPSSVTLGVQHMVRLYLRCPHPALRCLASSPGSALQSSFPLRSTLGGVRCELRGLDSCLGHGETQISWLLDLAWLGMGRAAAVWGVKQCIEALFLWLSNIQINLLIW